MLHAVPTLEGLSRLVPSWLALMGDAAPMLGPDWAEAAARAFGRTHALSLLHDDGEAGASVIAPLGQLRSDVLWRYEILGAEQLGEPVDLVYRSPEALQAFAEELYARGVPLFIKRIWADSPTLEVLTHKYSTRNLFFTRPAGATPWLSFDDGAKEPEARFDAGRRSDFRRALKKAKTRGPVELTVRSPAAAEVDALLDEAMAVEASGWKGRQGSALRFDQERQQFVRHYARSAAEQDKLRLGFLRVDGQAAAMVIAIQQARRLWLLKIGYDEAYKSCSPGMLLIMETVRAAMDAGLEGVEFLGTEAPWTQVWTRVSRPCVAFRAYPARPRGLATLAADAAVAGSDRVQRYVRWG